MLALNQRHILAAAMIATGKTQKEVCNTLNFTPNYMSILYNSPIFKNEVKRLQQQMQNSLLADAVTMLVGESLNNVRALVEIRDNYNLAPSVRIKAVDSMLDRVATTAKNSKVETAPREATFSQQQIEYLITALDDDEIAKDAFREASQRSFLDLSSVDDNDTKAPLEITEFSSASAPGDAGEEHF